MQGQQPDVVVEHLPAVVKALVLPAVRLMSWTATPYYMTPQDITYLSDTDFAKLYTVSGM